MPPALGRAPDRSLAAAPAAGSLRRPPATAARLASQCSLRAHGAGPGGVRRAQPQQHAALFQSLVYQLEVGAVAAPGNLGDLGQHELQILEQALEPRVLGGRRIEHQPRRREQVARLAGELNVDPPGARLGAEAREQGLGAAQVLRRRYPVGEIARRDDDSLLVPHADAAEAHADREHRGGGEAPAQPGAQRDHPGVPRPARRRNPLPYLLPGCVGRPVVVLRGLAQQPIESVLGHETHSPAKSASASRSLARARDSCAFEVPVSTPSAWPISSCVYPSTSCIRNTVRYPSGKSSIARASRTLRSGSASRPRLPTPPAASRSVSRWRKRFSLRSPFKVTDVAMT